MELIVLNEKFQRVFVIDEYESLLWVDRYQEPGSFELDAPITEDILKYVKKDYYIQHSGSEHTMIVEDFAIDSDAENGNKIKITGRSLESILDRRVVWKLTSLTGNLQTGINNLLTNNIINPPAAYGGADRQIANFAPFVASTDEYITTLKMDNQYTGDVLLDVIEGLCKDAKIGWKIILNDNNQFEFSLYRGADRSYRQSTNPYVEFKPSFGNIINSSYVETNSTVKNVALVGGEGAGTARKFRSVGTTTGLGRREMFVNASDLRSADIPSGTNYNNVLDKRGTEKLAEVKVKHDFDGKCETTNPYLYGRDFFIGDIVQIANEYGMETPSLITEFVWSCTGAGVEKYPTFVSVEEEE